MIQLSRPIENRLIQAAKGAGQNIETFLSSLLDEYLEDKIDIEKAEAAMLEEGEVSHKELKAKYGL